MCKSAQKAIDHTEISRKRWMSAASNQISCHRMIAEDSDSFSEDGDYKTEKPKCGRRQGKRLPAPDFRRKAGDQLDENKYNVKPRCE